MEDLLTQLAKEASSQKHGNIRKSAQAALDLLENPSNLVDIPAYKLREKCLEPLQLALESKTKKLATHAIGGIQQILKDERFQSSMESDNEENWLPIQVLNTVFTTPTLTEDTQVEIMKLLLSMSFSTVWCMNAGVITRVSQVYIDIYTASAHSVRGAVIAALTQLLSSFTDKLHQSTVEEDGSDVLADFKAEKIAVSESSYLEMVAILTYFTSKLEQTLSHNVGKQAVPLLLEGVATLISHCPGSIRDYKPLQEVLWKHLCPCLISLLGTPKSERSGALTQKTSSLDEVGRGSGCSVTAPNIQQSTAKTIYSICVSLVELMGPVGSLRPVLESVFHRMLLYPPPQHRLDALKAVKELLKTPKSLYNLASPTLDMYGENSSKSSNKNPNADISLLKLIVDAVQESCHCNDMAVCITSVTCVDVLLGSLEQACRGVGMTDDVSQAISKYHHILQNSLSRSNSTRSESSSDIDREIHRETVNGSHHTDDSQNVTDEPSSTDSTEEEVTADDKSDSSLLHHHHSPQRKTQSLIKDTVQKRHNKLGSEYEAIERENAKLFITELGKILPQVAKMVSIYDVDEALQNFASNFCSALYDQQYNDNSKDKSCQMAILNADGVYMATINALLLCLKLETAGVYDSGDNQLFTEKQFLDEVLGSGLLLFLSPAWLSEVYQQILHCNIFSRSGCDSTSENSLIQLLNDIDGLDSHEKGGQLLMRISKYSEEDTTSDEYQSNQFYADMGKKFSKRILSRCWDGVLDVLSVLLNGKNSCGISSGLGLLLGMEGAKEESIRAREAICMSLDGLQKAARLCCILGLQQRCGSVFSLLASTSCVLIDTQKTPSGDPKSTSKPVLSSKPKPVRLHASHILSMDVVMTNGLEMGSHSADCWRHVFRCSAFISDLEHTYFSRGNNQSSLPKVQQGQALELESQENCDPEMYSVPVASSVPVAPRINIPDLIRQSSIESAWDRSLTGGGVLNSAQASKALCGLSQEVDRLFENAAESLNLRALVSFLSELCDSSQHQLVKMVKHLEDEEVEGQQLPLNALHLYRLQEVLMKLINSDRPMVHLMRVWSIVSCHLVESAGHHDRSVSKMAVTCVHDFILAMLSNHPELPHFHVNELLCKTFENMLCLELCDGDVQDQIVCSICELVEACTADIKSGWRPLFGALRAVKIEYTTNEEINEARQRHVAAVLDVFEVYLNTDNIIVFANATVDCILCLLKYVRGPGEFEDMSDDEDSDSGSDFGMVTSAGQNLCIPALGYLKRCSEILQTMWKMPACPVFNGAHRIHSDSTQVVDPILPHMNMDEFSQYFKETQTDLASSTKAQSDAKTLPSQKSLDEEEKVYDTGSITSVDSGITITTAENQSKVDLQGKLGKELQQIALTYGEDTLDSMDNQSGILHVWFLLIDGLAGSVSSCPKTYQPDTLEMLFSLLKSITDIPGPTFSLYCVNRLLLPMMQCWLRSGVRKHGYWEMGATNFKQCCGLCTDLVVDFTTQFSASKGKTAHLAEVMIKQLLDILIECVAQPVEVISRLGCSCIRHILISAGESFTETMWQICVEAIDKAMDVTTYHLQQLMLLFETNSENFYGDKGEVKVAMRQDSSAAECQRLQHLAHQVFLLDSQINRDCPVTPTTEEDKSFVFLLYPPGREHSLNPDDILSRIPFRNIVVGLLSHQLLLQTIGTVLLSSGHSPKSTTGQSYSQQSVIDLGMIPNMSTRNVLTLLRCLQNSSKQAGEFDSRPGLKFLIQKVARTEVAVNLYKQAGASMVFFMNSLVQICSNYGNLTRSEVRTSLIGWSQKKFDISIALSDANTRKPIEENRVVFIQLLNSVCNDLCQIYVNMLSDDMIERVDKMADREVFFLIAQPDSINDIINSYKKTDKNQTDKNQPNKNHPTAEMPLQGVMTVEPVALQDDPLQSDSSEQSTPKKEVVVDSEESKLANEAVKSKRELREEHDSKVYTLATDTLIKSLMTEYKKRKHHHAMPSFVKITKQQKSVPQQKKSEVVDETIEKQQKSSIMKDSEARSRSLTELLCTVLGVFQQLSDEKFDSLLPTVFNCVNQLVCHAQDAQLKEALGQWLHRVGLMLELAPPVNVTEDKST